MNLRFRFVASVACLVLPFLSPVSSRAALTVAENLLVDLDVATLGFGDPQWANNGSLGGMFNINGDSGAGTTLNFFGGMDSFGNDIVGVEFNGSVGYQGPVAPAGITGNGTRSIEVWAYNPAIVGEETLVAWGRRGGGPDGSNESFNYGNHPVFGAAGHWGQPDMPWGGNAAPQVPSPGQWHHLVYTYNGTAGALYADGVLKYFRNVNLNTHGTGFLPAGDGDFTINVAAQNVNPAPNMDPGLRLTGAIAKVRVHEGVLSAADVAANFNEESPFFYSTVPVLPPPPPPPVPQILSAGPRHRYEFNGNADDTAGTAHGTVVNPTGTFATFATMPGQLDLRANNNINSNQNFAAPTTPGAYVDLPNGTISSLGTRATFEAWITVETNRNWARIFDFGRSDAGENSAAGAPNSQYIFLAPRAIGGPTATCTNPTVTCNAGGPLRFAHRSANPGAAGFDENFVDDNIFLSTGVEHHVVAVWDEVAGTHRLYLDGAEVEVQSAVLRANITLGGLQDLNNWLGRAQWGDPLFDGLYNEFRIYDYALSAGQILGNFQAGPDALNVIPEPSSGVLLLIGILGLVALRRRGRR